MDLTYNYNRGNSKGSLNGKTGQLTHIIDNLDGNKDRVYEYDALNRLVKAKGGAATGASVTANWTQDYAYDRYGNKTSTSKTGYTANYQAIPLDGLSSISYDQQSNRINTAGYEYDKAGNLVRGQDANGNWERYDYDAMGCLRRVLNDAQTAEKLINVHGASRKRVVSWQPGYSYGLTWYVWGGNSIIAEYISAGWGTPITWDKSYIYAGSSLLSTITNTGGTEVTEYHHPDRLGTRLITNPVSGTQVEQVTLPFGTSINAETTGTSNQRFTSYDRSGATGLDYAVNRTYTSSQGRFTQVDPIGMGASSLDSPQTLNLYSYCGNDPINHTDPDGLFFGKLFKWIGKASKWIMVAVIVATAILTVVGTFLTPVAFSIFLKTAVGKALTFIAGLPNLIGNILSAASNTVAGIFSFAAERSSALIGWIVLSAGSSVGAIANSFASGKPPREKKQSIDSIALEWLKIWNPISIKYDAEIGARICKNLKTGKIATNGAAVGSKSSVTPPECPKGTVSVARIHTHGAYDPNYDSENFSSSDRRNVNNESLDVGHTVYSYIATPSGSFKKFIPASIRNSTRGKIVILTP